MKMKNVKKMLPILMLCAVMVFAFTACHSHEPEWRIDTDNHYKECSCGEISEKGEHSFEEDKCTVCGAERITEDGVLTDMQLYNSFGDWTQRLLFDGEGNCTGEESAVRTYDKDGNRLTEELYSGERLISSAEYDYDSEGLTFKKYETDYYDDGTKCVYEFNESGDSLGYVIYDEEGNALESYRSEYITDEKGELIGERVYENDVLTQEIKYAAANDGTEEYLYAEEVASYDEDGSKSVEKYDEAGDLIKELLYDAEGEKLYEYDLEYFFDDEGNPTSIEKRENGELKQELIYEYDEYGNILAEKTYEGDRLIREAQYAESDFFMYEARVITYNEDGTTTVEEYDENGELIEAE